MGTRFGPAGGARKAKGVISVALQLGDVAPETAEQVAVPSAVDPFMNCTVPVGLAPEPVPATVAVKVTLPPPAGRVVGDAVSIVVVMVVPAATTTVAFPAPDEAEFE